MLARLSQNLNPRLIFLLLGSAMIMLLSSAYAIWFKTPLKQFSELEKRFESLEQPQSNPQSYAEKLEKLEQDIEVIDTELAEKIQSELLKGIKPLALMTDLGNYAKKYNVQMVSVTPATPVPGKVYTETPFRLDLMGNYKQLFNWIYTLEHSGTPVLIKDFSLMPGDAEDNRLMSLNLGLIQLNDEG